MLSLKTRKGLYWLIVLPALFTIYETTRLLNAFWQTVKRNQTLIESYKEVSGALSSTSYVFEEYFGRERLGWFFPTFVAPKICDLLENNR